jgi:hypothetical protein
MRMKRWLLLLLLCGYASVHGANHAVWAVDPCPVAICFAPDSLTINAGDTVTFLTFSAPPTDEDGGELPDTRQKRNLVADDGSFRCARGCDGEGGDGTPVVPSAIWSFTRTFKATGVFGYHDEVSRIAGVIAVLPAGSPIFAISPGITGAWFDPAQNGHGIFVEVLPNARFLAWWFTFDPGAHQAWFGGVGTYGGNVATITAADMPTGARWIPNFDPAEIAHHSWGTLTLTFTDCNHGRVDFSSGLGFGAGSMNLTRLTQPAGLACP